jgi:pimeloyl-ACP methyl ester carboxylesterase
MPVQKLGEVSIYYERTDFTAPWKPKKPTLLFVHGLNCSHEHWFQQVAYFSQRYPVLTLDLRGHGRSSMLSEGYSVDHYTRDIIALLDALALDEVHVVGSSIGGWLAQQLAVRIPHKVRSIVAEGSSSQALKELNLSLVESMVEQYGMEGFFREFIPKATFPPDVDKDVLEFTMGIGLSTPPDIIMQRMRESLVYDGRDAARSITCPAMVLVGEHDNTTPRHYSDEMRELISGSQLAIIPNCGHLPHLEAPEVFNSILDRFLKGTGVGDD